MESIRTEYASSPVAKALGLESSVSELESVLNSGSLNIKIDPGSVDKKNDARYSILLRTLYLANDSPNKWALAHELMHADITLFTPGFFTPRRHGGAGYEKLANEVLSALHADPEPIASQGCKYKGLKAAWHGFWAKYAQPEQLGGGVYQPIRFKDINFTFDASDFRTVKRITTLGLSCSLAAQEINKIWEGNNCCYRVNCNATSSSFLEIASGVNINDVFK